MQSFIFLVPFISLCFYLLLFYLFSNPYPCLSGFVEIPVPIECCVWKGWASPSAARHVGQAACVHCLGFWQVLVWNVLGVKVPPELLWLTKERLALGSRATPPLWSSILSCFWQRFPLEAWESGWWALPLPKRLKIAVCINIKYFPVLKWSQWKKGS